MLWHRMVLLIFSFSIPSCCMGQSLTFMNATAGAIPLTISGTELTTQGFVSPGTVPSANLAMVNVGFNFVRPIEGGGISLLVPSSSGEAQRLDASGELSRSFGFVPRLDAVYQFQSLGIGLATSAEFLSIGGTLQRTVQTGNGSADLTANGWFQLYLINPVEIVVSRRFADLFRSSNQDGMLSDTLITTTLGTRLAFLNRSYDSKVQAGTSANTANATQSYAGFGLTTSIMAEHPISEGLDIYAATRGSMLLGQNTRKSTISGSLTNNLQETKSLLMPVGEFELGLQYSTTLSQGSNALVVVRGGAVCQLWGHGGFLPADEISGSFGQKNLVLLGFTIVAGIQY